MLHYRTIESGTLELLNKLQAIPALQQVRLNATSFMVLKSLAYFDDAEEEPDPYMFESIDWNVLKSEIRKQVASLS